MCTPTRAEEDSRPLSHFRSAEGLHCLAPLPSRMCRRRQSRSKAVERWRRFVRLLTFFKDERTAFSQASQSLKFFAARRVHLLAFASAGSESALRTPTDRRNPGGWQHDAGEEEAEAACWPRGMDRRQHPVGEGLRRDPPCCCARGVQGPERQISEERAKRPAHLLSSQSRPCMR